MAHEPPELTPEERLLVTRLGDGSQLTPELVGEYLAFVSRRRQALDVFLSTAAPEAAVRIRGLSESVARFLENVTRALDPFVERDLVKVADETSSYCGRPGLVTAVETDARGETAVFVDFNDGQAPTWFRPLELELVSRAHRVDPAAGEPGVNNEDRQIRPDGPDEPDDYNPLDYMPPTPGDLEPA